MNKEEIIISNQNEIGFMILPSELTTGKIIINNIEITSVEDWDKVIKSLLELQQQNKKYKEVIDKLKKHCEIEINASSHYLENHSSQKELCHKVAHQRILDILKEEE